MIKIYAGADWADISFTERQSCLMVWILKALIKPKTSSPPGINMQSLFRYLYQEKHVNSGVYKAEDIAIRMRSHQSDLIWRGGKGLWSDVIIQITYSDTHHRLILCGNGLKYFSDVL